MKKIIKNLISLILVLSISLVTFVPIYANDSTRNNERKQDYNNIISQLLNERVGVIENRSVKPRSVTFFGSRSANVEEYQQRKIIFDFKKQLENMGEKYSDVETNFDIFDINKISNDLIEVNGIEETYMYIENTNDKTGYTAKHQFIFEKINEELVLVEDRQLEPSGLMPLQEAEKFVYNNVNKYYNNDNSNYIIDENNQEIPASKDKNLRGQDEKNINSKAGYDYRLMGQYLERYWNNYNSAYRDFSSRGGDCTNFVSQALNAGGWGHISGYYTNTNSWWYNWANQTYSWTSVEHWAQFARNSGRTSSISNIWDLGVGDVLQVKPNGSSVRVHAMMVSYRANHTPYFTYHSSNRYRRSLNQVILDWPGATFYTYRT